jgi:anti-sigma factor RsiW
VRPVSLVHGRQRSCLSDYAIDRWRCGELAGPSADAVRAHLDGCCDCRTRADRMGQVVAPVMELDSWLVPPASPSTVSGWGRRRLAAVGSLLAVAAFAIVALVSPRDGERTKGQPWWLGVIARHPDGVLERVGPHGRLSPGDHLRFEVRGEPRGGYVSIISLDGSGAVSAFVPAGGVALRVSGERKQLLDGAVVLDGVLGAERIMYLACPAARPVGEIVAAARAALTRAEGDPARVGDLGTGCFEGSFWIQKVARR